jgi:folate-binding protein YgfZ
VNKDDQHNYDHIRGGGAGFYEKPRGLIAVWGGEAVQFLDGLITNDVKRLEDGQQMLAAFPDAKGRLLAVVRVQRSGDRYVFETELSTRQKVFEHLFRFTFAGDFFVEDLSESYSAFEMFGPVEDVYHPNVSERWKDAYVYELPYGALYFVPSGSAAAFRSFLADENRCPVISDDLFEVLRIENGVPLYGIDMDETTVVPELGIEGLISYNKGCYVGQEIIARIHFRGHVAKQLTGIFLEPSAITDGPASGAELTTVDGKNAGKITSVTFSPKLEKTVALAYVRYEQLAEGTKLQMGTLTAEVTGLPFIEAARKPDPDVP